MLFTFLIESSLGIDFEHFMEEATTLIKSEGHQNVISLVGTCIIDAMLMPVKTFRIF